MANYKKDSKKTEKQQLYIAPEGRGRPRRINGPDEMFELWEEYKADCDSHTTVKTFVSNGIKSDVTVKAPRTYTIMGFCAFIKMTQSSFDKTYRADELYSDVIELMEMETELDARGKFEDGSLNAKLAGLWMGRHKGYSVKNETEIKGGGVPVVISGEDALKD